MTHNPESIRRTVAVAAVTFLLALTHKVLTKDRTIRTGQRTEKLTFNVQGVIEQTLGILGFRNIGHELTALGPLLGLKRVAGDPIVAPEVAGTAGADLISFDDLLRRADYVCNCCAPMPDTQRLINAERLALIKKTTYLFVLAPHALCWTNACFNLNRRCAPQSLIDVARGVVPENVVNRCVLGLARLRHLKPREKR